MLRFNTVTEQGLTSIGDYVPGVGHLIDGLLYLLKKIWEWLFGPDEEEQMRKEFELIERLIAQCKRNGVEEIELEIHSNTFSRYNASILSQGEINILSKGSTTIKLHIVFSKNKDKK